MNYSKLLLSTALALSILTPTAFAKAKHFDFGDNTSRWADDGECDDPRFTGQGMADILLDKDIGHDANDCQRLVSKGRITIIPVSRKNTGINFGDDSSRWANDNECDDPRFEGPGVDDILLEEDRGHDATDCRNLMQQGRIQFVGTSPASTLDTKPTPQPVPIPTPQPVPAPKPTPQPVPVPAPQPAPASTPTPVPAPTPQPVAETMPPVSTSVPTGIDFGNDSENRSHNGICDDPRFQGPGMAEELYAEQYQMHDATDCRELFEQGQITDLFAAPLSPTGDPDTMVLGDNSSEWANDGQCDDPRFAGPGVAYVLLKQDLGHDTQDCRALLQQGLVYILSIPQENYHQGVEIYLGDDASSLANNGTCDDRRFQGYQLAGTLQDENIGHDATDCFASLEQGGVFLPSYNEKTFGGGKGFNIDFGDNVSDKANNGVCDDPRFEGSDMGQDLDDANIGHDAYDCQTRLSWRGIHLIEQ